MNGRRNILIVEHSPIQAARLEAFLRKQGYATDIATSAGQAKDKARQRLPDLVVAGAGLAACLTGEDSPTPVIVFADSPGGPDEKAAGFVAKSGGLEALAACLDAALGSGPERRRRRGSVLAADDNKVNLMLAEYALTRAGYEAVAVDCGEEAVRRANDRAFDLILMDVQMPDIDGAEAARRIRSGHGASRNAPILALTGHSREELGSLGIEAFDGYVPKPFDIEEFERLATAAMAARSS